MSGFQHFAKSMYLSIIIGLSALIMALTGTAQAQSALDGFDPNANATVRAIVVQADGKILIGGDFTTVLGVTRNRIARLNADGTLDTGFNPNASNNVLSIVVQSDGKILAGGNFTTIGGQTRNRIARLDAATGLADSWNPNADSAVNSIAVQSDGKVLAGGSFTTIGGQTRNRIARLDATTGLADSFDPNASDFINSIAVQSNGKILAGGNFATIGGQTRNRIARLDAMSGLAESWNPNANATVNSIAVQSDGKVLAGGAFTTIGGQTRNRIARLDATTGLVDSWNPNATANVNSIAVQSDGKVLAGGEFTNIGGQSRSSIARLDAATGLADSFNPNATSDVNSIAVQSDGKILAGGIFTTIGGQSRNRIARLERDGTLDRTLDANLLPAVQFSAFINVATVQSDGKIVIGGDFTSVLGVARNKIARLNPDGTLDAGFNPNADNTITSIVAQPDGKILVGGFFTNIGGQPRNLIARLDGTTGLADSWNPNATGTNVNALALQADGKILAGGVFSNIGGQARNNIARLDTTTGLADTLNPNANGTVRCITIQADGKILVGGFFNGANSIGGQTRNRIARLDAATGLADSWDPNSPSTIRTIVVQSDGKILVGGQFNGIIGGQTRSRIARFDPVSAAADSFNPTANQNVYSIVVQSDGKILMGGFFTSLTPNGGATVTRNFIARVNSDGTVDTAFDPNADFTVDTITLQSDGKILVGGDFVNIGGQPRFFFARLSNNTAALSTLAVTQTTLTLTRNGSAAQFGRVIFEQSIDNGATYTLLGTATNSFASPTDLQKPTQSKGEIRLTSCVFLHCSENLFAPQAAGYTLTGQTIPTGQNVLIRARGFYRSGFQGGSETAEDKVQNAFLSIPTAANVSLSGRVLTADGRGLRNAVVSLTKENGETIFTRTSSFGYYRFDEIEVGQTVILAVSSKRYQFTPRVVSLSDELTELDFVALPD